MVVLSLTELAALYAVYVAHFNAGGATFGTTTGSLSIIALAVNTAIWMKVGSKNCGCGDGGCATK